MTFGSDGAGYVAVHISHIGPPARTLTIQTRHRVSEDFCSTNVIIDSERSELPVGRIAFADTTCRPGRFVFEIAGNTLDVMPDRLLVDGREIAWEEITNGALNLREK